MIAFTMSVIIFLLISNGHACGYSSPISTYGLITNGWPGFQIFRHPQLTNNNYRLTRSNIYKKNRAYNYRSHKRLIDF
jgi:hypothetical protein